MIDIQHQSKVLVYKRKDLENKDDADPVTCYWEFDRRIRFFPIQLTKQVCTNAIFSPDLKRFLDFDPISQEIILRSTFSDERIHIPKGIISNYKSPNFNFTEQEYLLEIKKRFMFHSNTEIRVVSLEDNIDAIWTFETGEFKLKSAFFPRRSPFSQTVELQDGHFFFDPQNFQTKQTARILNKQISKIKNHLHHNLKDL